MITDVKTIIEIITAMLTSAGIAVMVYFAVKKGKPEVSNIEQQSHEHEANAAEKALAMTERAMQQLDAERTKRRELQKTVDELRDQLTEQDNKLESQRMEYEKKLYHQKTEYDRKFDIMRGNMAALASQVVQLGGTPIKLMGE